MQRVGEIGWMVCLAGLPFANFLCYAWLDRWQAQATWAHLWVLLLFSLTLCRTARPAIPNRPLAAWFLWNSLMFLWAWFSFLKHDQYPLLLLMPWMHLIVILAFYHAATQFWTRRSLQTLLCWVARAGLVGILYGYVQWVGLDQFYRQAEPWMVKDAVVGNVGNEMHFSVYLALLLPIFLWRGTWRWHLVAWAAVGLILNSGSATGTVCALGAVVWWALWQWPRWTLVPLAGVALAGCQWVSGHPDYLNSHGRVETWMSLWQQYLVGEDRRQITGMGLGHLMAASTMQASEGAVWRHAHSEWLQALIEQGLIGVSLLGWGVVSALRRLWAARDDEMAICLGGVFLVFLVSSVLGFPAHLWVLGSLGLLAYCGLYLAPQDPLVS